MAHHDIREMQGVVVDWADRILGNRDPRKTAMKLTAESVEVQEAIAYLEDDCAGSELADVLILLLDLAHLKGIDLAAEFERKMKVNNERHWKAGPGCFQHVKE